MNICHIIMVLNVKIMFEGVLQVEGLNSDRNNGCNQFNWK